MTQDLKQIVEKEAERVFPYRSWHTAHNIRTDIDREKFIKGANFALGLDRWVNVSERMPDNRQTVLATDGSTQIVLEYKHGCWFVGLDQIHFVTHWMELPKLPQ